LRFQEKMGLLIDAKLVSKRIERLSRIGRTPEGGVTRPGFSPKEEQAKALVRRWMAEAGLETRVDAALNLIGTRLGRDKKAPVIMTGSHLDSVPNGGKFDGVLGVLGAIEAMRSVNAAKIETQRTIEVIVFTAEEPNPFGVSTFGSRALSGSLPQGALERADPRGRTLDEILSRRGGKPEDIASARTDSSGVAAFVELHIEQGPVLDSRKIPIGIVSHLCGINRLHIDVRGRADHAGTTSMDLRRDALVAASEVILAIEGICRSKGEGVVGTVGKMNLTPNQVNVVPGHIALEVDLRALDHEIFDKIKREILEACKATAQRRGLEISLTQTSAEPPIELPESLSHMIAKVCETLGVSYLMMPSGAGHDANRMAKITRTAVIFVSSHQGLSHCPQEWTDERDIETGVRVLCETLVRLANEDG